MARPSSGRIRVSGYLETLTALHVGGMGDSLVDLPLARNGAGELYIPGTSLAGVLRDWCYRHWDGSICRQVWGGTGKDDAASRLLVEDMVLPIGVLEEIRDHVGIDRRWGAAADAIKFDRAVIPRGVMLPLALSLELSSDAAEADQSEALLGKMLIALKNGEMRLGAAVTRGLGHIKLVVNDVSPMVERTQLGDKAGLLARLRGQTAPAAGQLLIMSRKSQLLSTSEPRRVDIRIAWRPAGPLMVKAAADGLAVDMLPLTSADGAALRFILPGSSVKGALRFQAERIVRTVLDTLIADNKDPRKQFLDDLDVPVVNSLFGSHKRAKRKPGTAVDAAAIASEVGRGALGVDDCYSRVGFEREEWSRVTRATDLAGVRTAIEHLDGGGVAYQATNGANAGGQPLIQPGFHVAIDRWTGGAADQFLFSVLEPHGVEWEDLCFSLDLGRMPDEDAQKRALALLLMVLDDLAAGWIPLGYGTQRGMGAVTVGKVAIDCSEGLDAMLPDLGELEPIPIPTEPMQARGAVLRAVKAGAPRAWESINTAWKAFATPQEEGKA